VQQALDIAAELDAYLDRISSPPSQVHSWWFQAGYCSCRQCIVSRIAWSRAVL
jgi:hypothetical protein